MSTRRKRWVLWSGLACFVLGATIAPISLWWNMWNIQLQVGAQSPGASAISNIFIDLNNGWSFGGCAFWFIIAWIGANLGGVIGIIISFAITKFKKL